MLINERLQHFLTAHLEGRQSADFVLFHEAAVADYIRSQDGGKTALGAFFGHAIRLSFRERL